jgi:fructose-1,6-bisphosphatase I
MRKKIISLNEFIANSQKDFSGATGELSGLLRDIGLAAKIINYEINRAGLGDILGATSVANTTGDIVQKLDMISDELFISSLQNSGECCGIASEENDDFVNFKAKEGKDPKYIVIFDPLDGSSNIDSGVSVGTIFAIYRRVSKGNRCTLEDFLQKGTEQVAAGYVLYGSSTILTYTTGKGVNGFTLDPAIGEFFLSHPMMVIPPTTKTYSVNQGNYTKYNADARAFIDYCTNNNLNLRYIGSMVADIHRTLVKGGIFFYPATKTAENGKLRLLYECNPLSFIVEQAGGKSSDGKGRILEVEPNQLHQRTPIFMGSTSLVEKMEEFTKLYSEIGG